MQLHEILKNSGIGHSDAELLAAAALERDRTWALAHGEYEPTADEHRTMKKFFEKRKRGEPISYITGQKEFYGRIFHVTRDVLIPRPSTEGLVDLSLEIVRERREGDIIRTIDSGIVALGFVWGDLDAVSLIADIGTGSGCIAVTLACELPNARCIATDTSEAALIVAKENAARHNVLSRIDFRLGHLLDPLEKISQPFLIVSNPPYVPEAESLAKDVSDFEPKQALFGGSEGLDVILPLVANASSRPYCRGIILECREDQAKAVTEAMKK